MDVELYRHVRGEHPGRGGSGGGRVDTGITSRGSGTRGETDERRRNRMRSRASIRCCENGGSLVEAPAKYERVVVVTR